MIEGAGLRIVAQKRVHHDAPSRPKTFYAVHKDRPFFGELVGGRMSAAPVVVQVLEADNAIARSTASRDGRDQSGGTPIPGTIRKEHALNMGENSVHGSDAPETAAIEIAQWFAGNEIVG